MRMLIVFCFVVLFAASQGRVRDARDSYIFKLMEMKKLPSPKLTASLEGITTAYYDQILDHFKPEDERRWRQRYYVNDEYFKDIEHGPVFLLIGGEGEAGIGWMRSGAWYQYAREVGALMIQLEHRFYGQSHPLPSMSVENLKYLTSQQALSDLVSFVKFMKESYQIEDNKWVTFGGSYPGSLSLWIRSKHPEIIAGAVGSSGPVEAKLDFEEYVEVLNDDMKIRDSRCPGALLEALEVIQLIINESGGGWNKIIKLFGLCPGSSGDNIRDVQTFFQSIVEMFAVAAQYDHFFVENTEHHCKFILDPENGATKLERLAKLVRKMYGVSEKRCLNINYSDMLEVLQDESSSEKDVNMRQWTYQTCNEFGWYQTGNLWGSFLPINFFTNLCVDTYGTQFGGETINDNIKQTNDFYGSKNPELTNAVITHGTFDPWHPMGILTDLNASVKTYVINGTSHCYDLQSPLPQDPEEVTLVRQKTLENIKKWIQ